MAIDIDPYYLVSIDAPDNHRRSVNAMFRTVSPPVLRDGSFLAATGYLGRSIRSMNLTVNSIYDAVVAGFDVLRRARGGYRRDAIFRSADIANYDTAAVVVDPRRAILAMKLMVDMPCLLRQATVLVPMCLGRAPPILDTAIVNPGL